MDTTKTLSNMVIIEDIKPDIEYCELEEDHLTLTVAESNELLALSKQELLQTRDNERPDSDELLALSQQEILKARARKRPSSDFASLLLEVGYRKKLRKTKFTNLEMLVLIREAEKRKEILQHPNSKNYTVEDRLNAWAHVTARVNKVGSGKRLLGEVRKKYVDFKSVVKKKVAHLKACQSGIGDGRTTKEELTPVEKVMAATLQGTPVSDIIGTTNIQDAEDVLPEPGKELQVLLTRNMTASGEAAKTCKPEKGTECVTPFMTTTKPTTNNEKSQQEYGEEGGDTTVQRTTATQTPTPSAPPFTSSQEDACQTRFVAKVKSPAASDVEKVNTHIQERGETSSRKDDLDYFFLSLCELTRKLTRRKQNRVKRDLLDILMQAEEEEL